MGLRALVGRALMGQALPLWAPLRPNGPGPHGSPWALLGRALVGHPGIYMYIYIRRIRRADRPNGVLDPGSEGPISDLPIFLCAISFSL